jgi:hypothetical protein
MIGSSPYGTKYLPPVSGLSREVTRLPSLEACFPGGYQLVEFRGAQFSPFSRKLARLLADAFPTFAFTIFLLIRKTEVTTQTLPPNLLGLS